MRLSRVTSILLAVFVAVGLATAPLVGPAAAKASSIVAMTDMSDMAASSADMPCCPEKHSSNDCQDCPLAAMCTLTNVQAVPPSSSGFAIRASKRTLISAVNDLILDGLNAAPPDHPPRILI